MTETEPGHAAEISAWEDEGGSQAGYAVDECSSDAGQGRSAAPENGDRALRRELAVETRAYLESLRRPRPVSQASFDAGTEAEQDAAVEAWQLDRRHAPGDR